MIIVRNPENGAPLTKFTFNKRTYRDFLKIGEKKAFEDNLAKALMKTYDFLEEFKLEGQYVCKYGDYAHDKKIAVVAHERGHKEEPAKEEGTEFITPQEKLNAEKAARYDSEGIPVGGGPDRDGVEWYGEGLTTDDEFMSVRKGKPGAF